MTGEAFSLPAFTMADYDLYRLDDRIFFAFIIAGLTFCVVHAARRAFRQPVPTEPGQGESRPPGVKEEEIQRHTPFQRVYHWLNSVAVLTLVISGWLIYQPRGFSSLEGPAFDRFFWHRWGVALLLVGIAFHVIYESFIARDPNPMAVNRAEAKRILTIFKNFFGLSKSYPLATKYHPGQIFFHWAVAGNLFLLILTGFVIWKPFRDFLPLSLFGLGWDFIFYCRLFHGFFSATLVASLIGHIYFALLIQKNWVEAKSMITGRVPLREYLDSHSLME
jgi:cytochrome b subunit of formate dehydrogenase